MTFSGPTDKEIEFDNVSRLVCRVSGFSLGEPILSCDLVQFTDKSQRTISDHFDSMKFKKPSSIEVFPSGKMEVIYGEGTCLVQRQEPDTSHRKGKTVYSIKHSILTCKEGRT